MVCIVNIAVTAMRVCLDSRSEGTVDMLICADMAFPLKMIQTIPPWNLAQFARNTLYIYIYIYT